MAKASTDPSDPCWRYLQDSRIAIDPEYGKFLKDICRVFKSPPKVGMGILAKYLGEKIAFEDADIYENKKEHIANGKVYTNNNGLPKHRLTYYIANIVRTIVLVYKGTRNSHWVSLLRLSNASCDMLFQHNDSRFSKDVFRYGDPYNETKCTQMSFNSGTVVETGSNCDRNAKVTAAHIWYRLVHMLGYKNVQILERPIQNLVATGI